MELVPLALGCGHVTAGFVAFHWDLATPGGSRVDCPEGCGLQSWVAEPALNEEG